MKKIAMIWLVLFAALLQSCGNGLAHFENDSLAFDYPSNLKAYPANDPAFVYYPKIDLGGEVLVGLGDPGFYKFKTYFRSILIRSMPMPPGADLETIIAAAYQQADEKFPQTTGVLKREPEAEMGGLKAIQKCYRVYSGEPAYELRDLWVQKGEQILVLSIWTRYSDPQEFDEFQAHADALIQSLRFK